MWKVHLYLLGEWHLIRVVCIQGLRKIISFIRSCVLAFDKTTGDKVTNLFYNAHSGDIIRHPIDVGSYDFLFLANQPAYQPVRTLLDAITHYGDLNHIAYPADFFYHNKLFQ